MIEIHDETNKNLSFFNFNKKFKKTTKTKNNKTNQDCHLFDVQITIVSTKIFIKNKKISNMKNEISLMKLKKRFFSRKNNKNLKMIFEYNYFLYVNEIILIAIQIVQQMIVVIENFNSKKNESIEIVIV